MFADLSKSDIDRIKNTQPTNWYMEIARNIVTMFHKGEKITAEMERTIPQIVIMVYLVPCLGILGFMYTVAFPLSHYFNLTIWDGDIWLTFPASNISNNISQNWKHM